MFRDRIRRVLCRVMFAAVCFAQFAAPSAAGLRDYPLRVEQSKGARSFELIAHNEGPATITLYMTISGENVDSDVSWPVIRAVPPHSSLAIGKLFPRDPKKSARLGYTQSIQYGDYRAVHAPDTKYRLPYQDGTAHLITQAYGDALSTHTGYHSQHAVDFAMPEGTPVVATRDGVVIDVTLDYDTGGMYLDLRDKANAVAIEHEDGTVAHYGHLAKRVSPVKVGQHVTAGTVIGFAGNTGYSSGPHLHYAVTKPEVLADGRIAHVALPVKFYVDTWSLPFEPRRGALVVAAYSREAAMRAAKAPADAGQRLSSDISRPSVVPGPALSAHQPAGQPASAPEAPPLTIAAVPARAPVPPPRPDLEPAGVAAHPAAAAEPALRPAPPEEPTFGLGELALIVAGAIFAVLIPAFFWRKLRA